MGINSEKNTRKDLNKYVSPAVQEGESSTLSNSQKPLFEVLAWKVQMHAIRKPNGER